mgnify:CR=1 FL=1
MNFYVHSGSEEPTGTEGRYIWRDLKTKRGAINRARRIFGQHAFSLYTFTDFYDGRTFKLLLKGARFPCK